MRRTFITAVSFLLIASPGFADVNLPAIFGDHMVLQRDKTVPIWGTASPNDSITITFGSATATARADASGKWSAKLSAMKANDQPQTLTVKGTNTVELKDVLVGDVWICAGQSNMGWSVIASTTGKEAVEKCVDPQLRLFMADASIKFEPQFDNGGKWGAANKFTVQNFTAVGYFAGRDLRAHLKIPIGLIEESLGGTSAEAWTSQQALDTQPELKQLMSDYAAKKEADRELTRVYDMETVPAFQKLMTEWRKKNDEANKKWHADADAAKKAGQPEPPKPTPSPDRPVGIKAPPNRLTPTVLFDGMINPILPLGIKGVLSYQGEHNTFKPELYRTIFPTMIADWRQRFGQGDFPFVYCQLSDNAQAAAGIANGNWPFVREVQTMGLKNIPNCAMVTTIDVGDPTDVHYHNKQPVGQRAALAIEHVAYGENTPTSGPLMDHVEFTGNTAKVTYKFADAGLMVGTPPTDSPFAKPADGEVKGFEMAGEDKVFHPAQATINGSTVTVKCSDAPKPVALRYGFTDGPIVNFYAKGGLPAVPFRTDDWPNPAETRPH